MTGSDVVCAVEHVTFSYPDGLADAPLFDDLSVTFQRGQTVALMGPSGCGKSTFAKMLGGILHPSIGAVSWTEPFLPPHEVMYTDQQPLNSVYPWQTVNENLRWPLKIVAGDGPAEKHRPLSPLQAHGHFTSRSPFSSPR